MELSTILMTGMLWLSRFDNKASLLAEYSSEHAELEHMRAENEKANQTLRHKSQEIADLLIMVERKNEALSSIKKDIFQAIDKARHLEDKSLLALLLNINAIIGENLNGDSILTRFEQEYNQATNGFLSHLVRLCPSLNVNERKACVYLRMNLSTKEIAAMLNLSVRGVETIRYNLRKKLGLVRGENLNAFLENMSK